MRWTLLTCLLLVARPSLGGTTVWKDGSFSLHTGGWYTPALGQQQGWKGLLLGLEMPDTGVMLLIRDGALEVYIPSKGWVADEGIMVLDGCVPGDGMQDTALYGATLLAEMRCASERNRVLMVARLPRNKTKGDTLPTKARWVPRREIHYEATD